MKSAMHREAIEKESSHRQSCRDGGIVRAFEQRVCVCVCMCGDVHRQVHRALDTQPVPVWKLCMPHFSYIVIMYV